MAKRKSSPKMVNDFDVAADLNNCTFLDYYKRLKLLALSMFKWENLPDGMNARYLEECLYTWGQAAFCKDPIIGFLNTKCTPNSRLNHYNEALSYRCYGIGYNRTFKLNDNMVFVRNNYLRIPTDYTIQLFAYRLYEAERTIDTNIKAQKTPVVILCDKEELLSMQNLYMKYDGNIPVIYGAKDLDTKNFTTLKTDAPYIADSVTEYKKNIWNEALSFLGVNNVMYEKKERLTKDEVNANNEVNMLSAQTMLLTREEAAEQFNKMFNQNVSVRLRTYEELTGGERNGSIYNTTPDAD